jgi:hypothetical protein
MDRKAVQSIQPEVVIKSSGAQWSLWIVSCFPRWNSWLKREYILFRDVEHCGIDSAPGINSTDSGIASNSVPFNSGIVAINSQEFRNPFQRYLSIPCDSGIAGTDSGSGIAHWHSFPSSPTHLLYATNSAIRFRIRNWTALLRIPRNSVQFRAIPESLELIPDPELLTDIHCHPHPHICYMQPIPLSDSGFGTGRN